MSTDTGMTAYRYDCYWLGKERKKEQRRLIPVLTSVAWNLIILMASGYFSIIWQHTDRDDACLMRWSNGLKQNVDGTQCRRRRQSPNKATVTNTDVEQVVSDLVSCGTACKAKEHKSRIYRVRQKKFVYTF